MNRRHLIFIVALLATLGAGVATWATAQERDRELRGYVDPTQTANLPFRVPRLGVNAELTQYTDAELRSQLALMQQTGITWVRQFVRWDDIETEPGGYDWSATDRVVDAIADFPDLRLVAVLVHSPQWSRDADTTATAPPTDPADFARFARAFALRYGATVDHYQIWDEPNITTGWGDGEPRPVAYLALLEAGYSAVHSADDRATVIAAALAPTTETTNRNISDLEFLRDLYALGGADSFDVAAAKPYGFDLPPGDRTVNNDTLNFSRIVALREIMVEHGDGESALWASHWGWNSLPDDWSGEPSIWGATTAQQQIDYTLTALNRADREWAWLGGLILHHWQPDAPPDDAHWGFALVDQNDEPTPLLTALTERSTHEHAADGLYAVTNPYAQYHGVWTFGELGADIGWLQDSRLTFNFTGRDLALLLRQDDYVAYLYPTIDGQPANATARDASGNAYIVLTSGDLQPEVVLSPVARNLAPGDHTLHVVADRGFDRWALVGYAVSSGDLSAPYDRQIIIALATTIIAGVTALVCGWLIDWRPLLRPLDGLWRRLGDAGQLAVSAATSVALLLGMLLTWGDPIPALFRRETVQLGLALITAGLIYVEPGLLLTIIAGFILFVIVFNRLVFGLMLTLFYAPFFLFPVELYRFAFPMSELTLLITSGAWLLNLLMTWARDRQTTTPGYRSTLNVSKLNALDLGVIAWVALGFVSLLWTQRLDFASTELRVMLVEPGLFYLILRTIRLKKRDLVRLVDSLLLAGLLVAVIGIWLFLRGESIITAEEGARRLASVYGSPNNVGLILGRCLPFALAYLLLPVDRPRRIAAGVVLAIMSVALLLTQSAGALLIGMPAAVASVLLSIYGRRAWRYLTGLAVAGGAAFAVALQSPRFARLLAFDEGTNFYRIRVWQSAVNVIRDYPLTGLGLDQFLYRFRGEYIMPDAWQEPNLSHPHNFLLDFWVRLGLTGVLVFAWVQFIFWRNLLPVYRHFRQRDSLYFALTVGVIGSMVNLLAHGLVDNSVYVNDLAFVFVLLLGLNIRLMNIRAIDENSKIVV